MTLLFPKVCTIGIVTLAIWGQTMTLAMTQTMTLVMANKTLHTHHSLWIEPHVDQIIVDQIIMNRSKTT